MRLAIASGKGGTGKTTLAVNLALKASTMMKTVLADLDVEEPNGAIFVGGELQKEKTVYRHIPGSKNAPFAGSAPPGVHAML